MWVAPLLDHLSAILCKLAVLADAFAEEQGQQPIPTGEGETDTENQYIEQAQQEMRDKVHKQLKSEKNGYDNRKFCNFYIQIRRIRMWFKLNNYKQCSNNFEAFEQSL
jgi:hypothetical protein